MEEKEKAPFPGTFSNNSKICNTSIPIGFVWSYLS